MANRIAHPDLLYPAFARRVQKGLNAAKAAGIPIELFETYRTPRRQQELYEQGRTKPGNIVTKAQAGYSWHNYGLATDVVMRVDGKFDWSKALYYHDAAQYFEAQGLHWAGHSGFELVHYQLPVDMDIYEVKQFCDIHGILCLFDHLNKKWS
jgi:hypothetical protein